jgi:hypothetical protein
MYLTLLCLFAQVLGILFTRVRPLLISMFFVLALDLAGPLMTISRGIHPGPLSRNSRHALPGRNLHPVIALRATTNDGGVARSSQPSNDSDNTTRLKAEFPAANPVMKQKPMHPDDRFAAAEASRKRQCEVLVYACIHSHAHVLQR